MKKLFFFVLINIIYLTPAWADRWTYVAESKSGNLTVYVDKNIIRSSGKTVVWWQLDSYKNKLKGGNLTIYSTISKIEGDCIRSPINCWSGFILLKPRATKGPMLIATTTT